MLADGGKQNLPPRRRREHRRPGSGVPRLVEHDQRVPSPRANHHRQPKRTDFTRGPGEKERDVNPGGGGQGHAALSDGDAVLFGSVEVTLHVWSAERASETKRITRKRR